MKKKSILIALVLFIFSSTIFAQHIKVKLNFPQGVALEASGPAPYKEAVWISPEWRWNGREYVYVPGFWMKAKHKRGHWNPGHWKFTRRGYIWIPGRWKR